MSYSIIMPAFNEERNLSQSVEMVVEAFVGLNYELIIVDDCSSDATRDIAMKMADMYAEIIYLRNENNLGRGGAILRGYSQASKEMSIVIQGKKDTTADELKKIINFRKDEDITLSYQLNFKERPFLRRLFSGCFTLFVNFIMGRRIKYYNGSALIKTKHLKDLRINNFSYSIDAEILSVLLNRGLTYREVGVVDIFEEGRQTRAFSLSNIIGVCGFFVRLVLLRLGFKNG